MIQTKRLELVPFDVKYAQELLEVWSDFEVIRYTYTPLITDRNESIRYIEHRIIRVDKDFTDAFIILREGKAIGMAGCAFMDKEKLVFGLYYQLARKYWGQGYASEAADAILKYVFARYPEAVIKAEAVTVNPASIAVLEKAGLKRIGVEKNGFQRNGLNWTCSISRQKNLEQEEDREHRKYYTK